jgi:tripartite-type tricarboxylate transporter receptor subunit TctC
MPRPWTRISAALALAALALGALALGATAARAGWPEKPLQLVVAFPPGGSTDIGARVLAGIAEKALGQPIVVVNKGGAGGQIGWTELARARPDGYTIGFINLPATNTVVLDPDRKAVFGVDAFVPVINQVLDPGVVWVAASSPYKTLGDLIEAARKAPNTIRTATTGILSDDHLAILMMEEAAPGAVFRIVHLAGGAEQMKGILAGDIDVAFDNVGSIVPRVKSGEVRALVVMDPERSKFLPDVPTTKELGYPTVVSNSTRGIAAPKGTPDAVVKKLAETFAKAMQDPEHVQKLETAGLAIKMMEGPEYAAYYAETHDMARKYTEWAKSRPHR